MSKFKYDITNNQKDGFLHKAIQNRKAFH